MEFGNVKGTAERGGRGGRMEVRWVKPPIKSTTILMTLRVRALGPGGAMADPTLFLSFLPR